MMSVRGVIEVVCDTPEEADGLAAMLAASPSPEIESWSHDGLEIGVTIVAEFAPPPPLPDE